MGSTRKSTDNVRVGTSGWSYPTGEGTWNGIFYPARGTAAARHAASSTSCVSTRSTSTPSKSTRPSTGSPQSRPPRAGRGGRRQNFEFSLKLFQKFTHPEMFQKATGADPLDLDQKDVDEFRAAIEPLARAGKLGALLAQFPASFKNEPNSRGYLEWLLERFHEYDVAVELRHRSWSDDPQETLRLLGEHKAAWAQIDEPKFRFSIRQNLLPNVRTFYYLRLHGRNAAQWWRHEKSEDRYNYLYSAEELEPFAESRQRSVA